MNFYPHVGARGGNILSTWPLAQGGFRVIDGTSMACPHVSGVVALYLSVKGKTNPNKLRNLIVSTARPVDFNAGAGFEVGLKTSNAQQGGGLIDAYRVLKSTTEIEPGFLTLNVRFLQTSLMIGQRTLCQIPFCDHSKYRDCGSYLQL